MLLTFKEEMQNCLNGLSEAEITNGNIRMALTDNAAELINSLSTENMKLLMRQRQMAQPVLLLSCGLADFYQI